MFNDSQVLVSGGTGSFGHTFVSRVLEHYDPQKVIVFSRDEMKQWEMAKRFEADSRVRFFIGDVRDRERVYRAVDGVDYVVHAAATKIVPTAEYNPFEAVKTNVQGAMNLIEACIDRGVRKVVALSTDKASSPVNLYGATKLVSDKLFTAARAYAGSRDTTFAVVRYGNVMGSRGSVIPYFLQMKEQGQALRITDPDMTRFMITLDEGVSLVEKAFEAATGGEIFVKKIPSMNILDIAEAVDPGGNREIVGVRPGEKIHEQMIGPEDSPYTWEFDDHFRLTSQVAGADSQALIAEGGKVVDPDFAYSSNSNSQWMEIASLQRWIHDNRRKMLAI